MKKLLSFILTAAMLLSFTTVFADGFIPASYPIADEDMSLVDDLGFDSLAFINMVVAIENDYGITFNDEYINMEKLKTVKDVKNYLVQSQS